MQLRQKVFIALFLLSSVPLLILLFGAVDRMEREVRLSTENQLHATLDKMRSELALILNSQQAIAAGLAQVPSVKGFARLALQGDSPPQSYRQRARELQEFFLAYQQSIASIQALRFIDANGKTLVKVKEGEIIEAGFSDLLSGRRFIADQGDRSFFLEARAAGDRIIMSDFELGQVTADIGEFCPAMVRYSVPLHSDGGEFAGVLVVNMWGSRLDATMVSALAGYPGKTYIVELAADPQRDGIYLYHPDNERRFANQMGTAFRLSSELEPAEWQAIRETEQHGSLLREDGRMLFYHKFAPYRDKSTQWLLVIEADRNVVFAAIDNMRHSIWILLGALLIVSLLLAMWASGRLAKPVQRLAGIIRRYADGDRGSRFSADRPVADEIGQAGLAFNYLAQRLETSEQEREAAVRAACQSERLAALGQLAAGIGHEINNPLNNILSLAALVRQALPEHDEQSRADLQVLQQEVQRCAHIVQGILNFARQSEPQISHFDMAELLGDTLGLLRRRIEALDIELRSLIETPLPIEGDANLLQQVLVNVLLNAIQAAPAGSRLYVTAKSQTDRVDIEFIDEGKGIANEHLSRIFDPFFTTKAEGEGTGLGLSVSYGIIQRHGGSIRLENTAQSGGARVHISLPRRQSVPHREQTPVQEQKQHAG